MKPGLGSRCPLPIDPAVADLVEVDAIVLVHPGKLQDTAGVVIDGADGGLELFKPTVNSRCKGL